MIIGKEILPRGSGIVTRRPTIIQLHNSNPANPEYAVFSHKPRTMFTDFDLVKQEIESEMIIGAGTNKGITPIPIVLKIFSPKYINL